MLTPSSTHVFPPIKELPKGVSWILKPFRYGNNILRAIAYKEEFFPKMSLTFSQTINNEGVLTHMLIKWTKYFLLLHMT
jgi:hypothetical protein